MEVSIHGGIPNSCWMAFIFFGNSISIPGTIGPSSRPERAPPGCWHSEASLKNKTGCPCSKVTESARVLGIEMYFI